MCPIVLKIQREAQTFDQLFYAFRILAAMIPAGKK